MTTLALDELVARIELLPKLPDTTCRLIELVNDPDSTFRDLVDAVRYDQTVTTELLRLCNSAYFGLSTTITSIDDAVRYIGTAKVLQLVMTAHTHALLGPEQVGYGLRPGALWVHSVGVALGCQALAARTGLADKGFLFTVGLLHDIGKVILNEYVADAYADIGRALHAERISFVEAEQRTIGVTHPEVGERVARQWKLPEPIPRCIRYHHEPALLTRPDALVDVVHIADAACLLMGIGGGDDSQMYSVDEAALARTGLAAGDIEKLGAQVVAELKSVQELFHAA